MAAEPGLRERKKQRTRETIAEVALRLFKERGFDLVTVAEIARGADVSEVTVFNHFATKEDLFYAGMEFFEERLLAAVASRPPGEPVIQVFRREIAAGFGRLSQEETADLIVSAASAIGGSRALQLREREIVAAYTQRLAEMIAGEAGREPDDVESAAVAGALMAAHRGLVAWLRTAALAGTRGPALAAAAAEQMDRAFGRLENGLAGVPSATVSDSMRASSSTSVT